MIRRPPILITSFLVWMLMEFAAFWLVVHFAGFWGAVLLALVATLAGIAVLQNLSRGAAKALRTTLEGGQLPNGKMLDGVLTALGAFLLILPGFVSDLAGLALVAPSIRQWIARRYGSTTSSRRRAIPDIVDLSPDDWKTVETASKPESKPTRHRKLQDPAADSL